MQQFRKQINESFFNPAHHFIPLLVFLFIDNVVGNSVALAIIYGLVVSILMYSYFLYSSLYKYLGLSYIISTVVISTIIFFPQNILPYPYRYVFSEAIVLVSLLLIVFFRKKIEIFVTTKTNFQLPMTNNLSEHFRIVWILSLILAIYIGIILIFSFRFQINNQYLVTANNVLLIVLLTLFVYEFIRVNIIRIKLIKEIWWPVVNQKGAVIGSIQMQESIQSSEKYAHPVVRIQCINSNKLYIQKTIESSSKSYGTWDIPLKDNIRMNETIDQCISRILDEKCSNIKIQPVFLSKYYSESNFVKEFVYLFMICEATVKQPDMLQFVKSWTSKQIEEELNSGIFTENFVKEYHILQRSGLIDNGGFKCSCRIKDTIYQCLNNSKSHSKA